MLWKSHWAPRCGDSGGLLPDWGGLSDQTKPCRTGHCGQQEAASSCGESCFLNRVGDLSRPPHKSFFFIMLLFFCSSEHALVCIFCQSAGSL